VAALVLTAVALGLLRGATATSQSSAFDHAMHAGKVMLTGTVREGPGSRRSANQVVIDADRISLADGELDVHGGVLASLRNAPAILPGDRVQLDATALRSPRSTGAETALARDGVEAVAQSPTLSVLSEGGASLPRLLAVTRAHLVAAVDAALPEPASSLVNGLAFAAPRPLPFDLTAALRDSGLAHMLATSGLKVVLIAGLAGSLLAAVACPPRLRLALMATAVVGYVALCGASPAAMRSAAMAATGWALYGTGRSPDPLPLLTAVAAAMLLVSPDLGRDVGFQLTFLGTLGILLFASPIASRLPGPRLLREPFAVTLAAALVTLPVMASAFGVVSLVGPAANALAVPLLAPLIVCGGLGAVLALVAPPLGYLPLQAAGLLATAIGGVAHWSAGVPFAAVHVSGWSPVLTCAEVLALAAAAGTWRLVRRRRIGDSRPWLATATAEVSTRASDAGTLRATTHPAWRRPTRPVAVVASCLAATLAGSVVVLAAARPDGRLHVAVLDVGAARAVVIQTATGERALVDAASDAQHLLQALGPALPPLSRSIGMLILTGGDRLGAGGVQGLTDRYQVDTAIAPEGLPAAARSVLATLGDHGTRLTAVPPGAAWSWGGATWNLLSTPGLAQPAAALHVADASGSALMAGNLDAAAQEELAGLDAGSLRADLLVAPPSGAVAPALLAAVHPRSIAVPTGRGARTATATLVAGPGVRRTGDAGTLTFTGGDGGLVAP
jgi:competence protein ComEC